MQSEIYHSPQKSTIKEKVHPDQKYIDALLNNDARMLNEVYQKYSAKIKWMVLQNRGTENDAADIFQDALLFIYQKAKTSGFTLTCPLDAFLYLICRNKWMSELNRRKVRNIIFKDTDIFDNAGEESFKLLEQCILLQARNDLFIEKFSELTESAKTLLRLSWSGKSMEEIASLLHVSYGYARKKKSECIAKLINLVKQAPEFNSLK